MIYKYDEIDFRDGMVDEEGIASLDSTVFVSDGGIFKGKVEDHGTLIIRGGYAEVEIGRYGKVHTHGGTLRAVVKAEGSLYVHEGKVTIKEEGGFVQANEYHAYVYYEDSVIENMVFNYNTSIHEHTKAVNCAVTPVGRVIIHKNGMFLGDGKLCRMQGDMTNSGIIDNLYVDRGTLACTDNCIVKHLVIDHKAVVRISSTQGANGIIVRNGTLSVGSSVHVTNVILEPLGRLKMDHFSYVTYRDKGGLINQKGGKLVRMKPKPNPS